jgi:hypothetical protein
MIYLKNQYIIYFLFNSNNDVLISVYLKLQINKVQTNSLIARVAKETPDVIFGI